MISDRDIDEEMSNIIGNTMSPTKRQRANKVSKKPQPFAVYYERDPEQKGVFFRDAKRHIDFVLAFDIAKDPTPEALFAEQAREAFHKSLLKEDLHLEIEIHNDPLGDGSKMGFVKIHATWAALSKYAEVLRIRMPIQYVGETQELAALAQTLEKNVPGCCKRLISYDLNAIPDKANYFSAPFSRPYTGLFNIEDKSKFFSDSQRIRIVSYILSGAAFDHGPLAFGIGRLLAKGCYTDAYPLHDGPAKVLNKPAKSNVANGEMGAENAEAQPHQRYLLYKHWASFTEMFKLQPNDFIRDYFGEEIGMYFAWIGDYTKHLYFLAFIGLIVFIFGAITTGSDETVNNVCKRENLGCVIMCPLCSEGCGYWVLYSSCMSATYSHLCDNISTIAYGVIITIWGTVFIELWHRRELVLRYEWDIYDYEEREPPRPEFEAKASRTRIDPLTGEPEPYEPLLFRILRGIASWTIIAVLIAVVFGTMLSIIIYRTVLNGALFQSAFSSEFLDQYGRFMISFSAAVINLIVILILTFFYERFAMFLTEWERHRTQSDFDTSYIIKMFIFQFANCYGTIFYTAFFRGRFQEFNMRNGLSPGMQTFVDYISDECDPAGCMADLSLQLAIVMIGRQLISHFMELVVPFVLQRRHQLKGLFHSEKAKRANGAAVKHVSPNSVTPTAAAEGPEVPRWEADFFLVDYTKSGVLHEYLEMVLQFGFVTLFGVCFPLSPLFALLNNIIEIRLDGYKLIVSYRRPIASMAEGIGIWQDILKCLIWISILSNALIIAFTSDNVTRMVYSSGYGIMRNESLPWTVVNDTDFHQTQFTFMMSVMSSNDTSEMSNNKYKPDAKCIGLAQTFADPPHLGGFGLLRTNEIASNSTNPPYCYYRGFNEPPWSKYPYNYTEAHWQLLVLRLAFALSFIIGVWILAWLLSHTIPHRPQKVCLLQRHEQRLHEAALLKAVAVDDNDDDGDAVLDQDEKKNKTSQSVAASRFPINC